MPRMPGLEIKGHPRLNWDKWRSGGRPLEAPAAPTRSNPKEAVDKAEVKEVMGDWLGELAAWEVFSTWTFARPVTVNGAMHCAYRHLQAIQRRTGRPPRAFVATERGGNGGLVHLHALLANLGGFSPYCGARFGRRDIWGRRCCQTHTWHRGIAKVFPYDPELGARHYVSKYVVKEFGEWELYGSFPKQL